ncbi:hypothetical protein F511_13067 [Dorcoceras hygrometricum]|uniref:Uncharacterized protein n=1 Tax=Dorcoceras hygrometricum TaxID=472368 RepID=A0A2Z7B9U0_9LAMI|nr:hypothetical protein F511_13067 [Dorcoceras hygrometricum]
METGRTVGTDATWYFVEEPDEEMALVVEDLSADKAISLEDILMTIPVGVPLPSAGIDESYYAKEELVLTWAEAESTGVDLQRKVYILMKYREMLLRKFLEARKMNFVPGVGDSAVDLKILDRLSDIHSFVLEELKKETQAYGLSWKKTCCSKIFEGRPRDRGAVIARTNTNTPSRCWIRTMILVDGVWVVEPCADQWVKIPKPIVQNEVPRQRYYDDTLPLISTFFRVLRKQWEDVCFEVCEFFVSGKLLPVGSMNFCRSLPVAQPVYSFTPRQPTVFALRLYQFCTVFIQNSLFSSLFLEDIRSFVGSIASERTVLRNDQIISSVASTDFVAQRTSLVLDQRHSSSSSSDESMNFYEPDTATTTFSRPFTATPDVTEALAQLQASIDQIRDRAGDAKLKDTLLMHLHGTEQRLTARLDDQDRVLEALRKNSYSQKQLLSLDIQSSHKQLSTPVAAAAMDTVDVRRVAKELDAKVTSLEEQVAATRHDLLEVSAQAQQTLNVVTDQLSELVAYINRGGNDKKGKVVSSRRPQPPPDDQNRDSGIAGGGGDTDRSVVERLLSADRQRQRERSRGHSSGSYRRRRY